jgi:hypothetical protein
MSEIGDTSRENDANFNQLDQISTNLAKSTTPSEAIEVPFIASITQECMATSLSCQGQGRQKILETITETWRTFRSSSPS